MRCADSSRLTFACAVLAIILFAAAVCIALSVAVSTPAVAQDSANAGSLTGLRGDASAAEIAPAPPTPRPDDEDKRKARNYPEQPPTIPHSIDGYEISLRANKCLACHSRRRSVETGAPMVAISHFMGRDLQVLSDISPRRYFCTQCHVVQTQSSPPVGNGFIDAADLPAR